MQATATKSVKWKNGRRLRRGDRFKQGYEGIIVDLFIEFGVEKALVYWILPPPDHGGSYPA